MEYNKSTKFEDMKLLYLARKREERSLADFESVMRPSSEGKSKGKITLSKMENGGHK